MATAEKITRFRRHRALVLANGWTAGSAMADTQLGLEAVGTTNAGCALCLGLQDGRAGKGLTTANPKAIAAGAEDPVSAGLVNGFGDEPEVSAGTIRAAHAN